MDRRADNGISVVIPVFNAERFIADAIDSVLGQDLTATEIIVVDDGSQDNTVKVLERYKEVTKLSVDHSGPSAARNAGIAVARGSFIAFLDADDQMKPTRLRNQHDYLAAHPELEAVLGRQEVMLQGVEQPDWLVADPRNHDDVGVQLEGSLMVRTEALRSVGGFNEQLGYSEGLDILSRMRDRGLSFGVLDKVVNTRRIHGGNMSNDTAPMVRSFTRVAFEHLKRKRSVGE